MNGLVHKLLMQLFAPGSSKLEVSKIYFFDIVATHNDHPSYVKHVVRGIYVFFTLFGYLGVGGGGGGSEGIGTLLMQFFTLYSSKFEISKHVLHSIYVFLTLFGYLGAGGGGGVPRDWYTSCLCSFSPCTAQNSKFPKLIVF